MRGVLHLVVGPSGVGKDTLIDAARAARPDMLFPTRVITRPREAGGEAHAPETPEGFARLEAAGAFMLVWRAHGLAYGIPAEGAAALAAGRHVMVNLSRGVVPQARARFAPVRVIALHAPAEALAARLAGRGREGADEIAERLRRADLAPPEGDDVTAIDNSGDLAAARAAFLAALAPPPAGAGPARDPGHLARERR